MPLAFVAHATERAFIQLWQKIKCDIGRLKIFPLRMADIVQQRSQRALPWGRYRMLSLTPAGNVDARQHPHGNRLRVPFDPGNLTGKEDLRMALEIQGLLQE